MRIAYILIIYIVLLSPVAVAQKTTPAALAPPCNVKVAQIPSYQGLKLKMLAAQVKQQLPGVKVIIDKWSQQLGVSHLTWTREKALETVSAATLAQKRLDSVSRIEVDIFRDQVWSFGIFYDPAPWKTNAEYSAFIQQNLGLPLYQVDGQIQFDCRELDLTAYLYSKEALFSLEDPQVARIIERRRKRLKIPMGTRTVLNIN